MSSGPNPSRVCFLSSLPAKDVGDKVRFLGCVASYSTATGVLTLQHHYPRGSKTRALVDMNLLLGNLKSEETQVGQWVNIIGYVTATPPRCAPEAANQDLSDVHVQAVVLWSAGPLDISLYEVCLAKMRGSNDP